MKRQFTAAALAAVAFAGALAGCGGSSSPPPSGAGARIGVPLRLADCTDWRNSDVAERLGTIRQLSDFAGSPVQSPAGPGHGATLPDEQAYKLLNGYCSASFARAFKLYKLYIRAAAFQGLAKYAPNN